MATRYFDERNGEAWDLPRAAGSRSYVIASVPRTGSTLLTRTLWASERVGAPKEYLNPMQLHDWELRRGRSYPLLLRGPLLALAGRGWSRARLRSHLDEVRAHRTGAMGWFGLKLHEHHHRQWFPNDDIETFLGPISWIYITRIDQVAQAVSWARARQTGSWASTQRGILPPIYSRRRIQHFLHAIQKGESAWEDLFQRKGVSPLRLTYEDLQHDLTAAVNGCLASLEQPPIDQLPDPGIRRQSDAINERWIRRFRSGR